MLVILRVFYKTHRIGTLLITKKPSNTKLNLISWGTNEVDCMWTFWLHIRHLYSLFYPTSDVCQWDMVQPRNSRAWVSFNYSPAVAGFGQALLTNGCWYTFKTARKSLFLMYMFDTAWCKHECGGLWGHRVLFDARGELLLLKQYYLVLNDDLPCTSSRFEFFKVQTR